METPDYMEEVNPTSSQFRYMLRQAPDDISFYSESSGLTVAKQEMEPVIEEEQNIILKVLEGEEEGMHSIRLVFKDQNKVFRTWTPEIGRYAEPITVANTYTDVSERESRVDALEEFVRQEGLRNSFVGVRGAEMIDLEDFSPEKFFQEGQVSYLVAEDHLRARIAGLGSGSIRFTMTEEVSSARFYPSLGSLSDSV